ncbi:alpha/beta fold hydrolase [Usitatibacter palustris]|uniref:AB hydrolase-1 domain-containing protein n=1 Tax=Usitatibacter palustris TaxID=2732487 RepID=A0A6M4H7U9_9PROT|nr:alpha/beta fold hydrolase [Usitatibacter palustris]QJR15729.1 hypothetical protein DSM104440_02555 [Usitatibacter palustris]
MRPGLCLALAFGFVAGGCVFRDVREQQREIDAACVVAGSVATQDELQGPIVVTLARRADDGAWRAVDNFVLEGKGRWVFVAPPGAYGLAAFEDVNRDLQYQPGEAFALIDPSGPIRCTAGARLTDFTLRVPEKSEGRLDATFDVSRLEPRDPSSREYATLGQLTSLGEVTALSHARFDDDNARSGMWRPLDFVVAGYAGVYFLEPYDPRKIPVLFVHGINGTPANFSYLIEHLDRTRFQPWVYYYPSGAHLGNVARHLDQSIVKLSLRHDVRRIAVVAHSMGGLVARGFVLQHQGRADPTQIVAFVTISTPWNGHAAAELGVKNAPAVVRAWEDIAPGSEYLRGLYARPVPGEPPHHLIFTFERRASSFGPSDDQTVTVASQLAAPAQRNATRVYGFDATHMSVLRDPEAAALVNQVLSRALDPAR